MSLWTLAYMQPCTRLLPGSRIGRSCLLRRCNVEKVLFLQYCRYIDLRYGGYEVVMKRPPRGERSVEMH